jgi:tetratricopeptide (TPR) repeat protein
MPEGTRLALPQAEAVLNPSYVDAWDSRGMVNLKIGSVREAIADYDSALRINPKHASALYARGVAKLRSGNTEAGKRDIDAATSIKSNIAEEFATYGIRQQITRPTVLPTTTSPCLQGGGEPRVRGPV